MNLPPYDKFPEIITNTMLLRQVQADDIQDIVEISFYDGLPAMTVEDAQEMQDKINADYQNGNSIHWGIADKNTNIIMGTLGYYRGLDKGVGELGCVLKSEFRGQGIMTEAIKLVYDFGLQQIGLTKIMAITTKQNTKAIKLLGRLNFVKISELPDDEIEYQFANEI